MHSSPPKTGMFTMPIERDEALAILGGFTSSSPQRLIDAHTYMTTSKLGVQIQSWAEQAAYAQGKWGLF